MKIGIGYTAHNRNKITEFSVIETLFKTNTWDYKIVVVDDASEVPIHNADFRFENNVGVSVAKNKCLELLYDADCTHFFLFDNDCRAIKDNWWLPYIESGLNHACYTFNRQLKHENCYHFFGGFDQLPTLYNEFVDPNGCMLFFTRKAINAVGGWDTDFKGFGYEHSNISDRIYNNGLTPARYIDIANSKGLFEMADCESSFSYADRSQIPTNKKLYQQKFYSKEFKEFR